MENLRKRTEPEVKVHERALFVQICADENQLERSASHGKRQRNFVFKNAILLFFFIIKVLSLILIDNLNVLIKKTNVGDKNPELNKNVNPAASHFTYA